MLGAIYGDILGSSYDSPLTSVQTKDFDLLNPNDQPTDDSVLTLGTAIALTKIREHAFKYIETNQIKMSDGSPFKSETKTEWSQYITDEEAKKFFQNSYLEVAKIFYLQIQSYGPLFSKWLQSSNPQPYGSYGNGSAMRVSPIGTYFETKEEVLRFAKLSSEVSHNHTDAIKAAQTVALGVFLAWKNSPVNNSDHNSNIRFSEFKKSYSSDLNIKNKIKKELEDFSGYNLGQSLAEIRSNYSFNATAEGSVPQAIICFLESENFEDAIRNAISLGGDADTQAAIAGSIALPFYQHVGPKLFNFCFNIIRKFPPMEKIINNYKRDPQNAIITHSNDGFLEKICPVCKTAHWGKYGASGVAIFRTQSNQASEILLQFRSSKVLNPGTWGTPGGGKTDPNESDQISGLRELEEEAGVKSDQVKIIGEIKNDHQIWHYTTVIALENEKNPITEQQLLDFFDSEAEITEFIPLSEVPKLPLLPAFKRELPEVIKYVNNYLKNNGSDSL